MVAKTGFCVTEDRNNWTSLKHYFIHNLARHSTINLFTCEIVICGVIKLISWKILSLAIHIETGGLCTVFR